MHLRRDELTEAEILEEQLVENLLREDLNPIEEAQSFRRYMELVGCHAKDLAQLLKINPSTVTRALSLLKLPEAVQEQVAAGDIPAKTGYEIAKLKDETPQRDGRAGRRPEAHGRRHREGRPAEEGQGGREGQGSDRDLPPGRAASR